MEVAEWPTSRNLQDVTLQPLTSEHVKLTNEQIFEDASGLLKLPPALLNVFHSPSRAELEYRLVWARTELVKSNSIKHVEPKIWEILA